MRGAVSIGDVFGAHGPQVERAKGGMRSVVKIGDVFGTRTIVGGSGRKWIARCSCGAEAVGQVLTLTRTQCGKCTLKGRASKESKNIYEQLVKHGVPRLIAKKHSESLPKPSRGLSFRHLLGAYRAAIAESFREEFKEAAE